LSWVETDFGMDNGKDIVPCWKKADMSTERLHLIIHHRKPAKKA